MSTGTPPKRVPLSSPVPAVRAAYLFAGIAGGQAAEPPLLSPPAVLAAAPLLGPCLISGVSDLLVVAALGAQGLRWGDVWHKAEGSPELFRARAVPAAVVSVAALAAMRLAGCVGASGRDDGHWAALGAAASALACVAVALISAVYGRALAGALDRTPLAPALRARRAAEVRMTSGLVAACMLLRAAALAAVAAVEAAGTWRGCCEGQRREEFFLVGEVGAWVVVACLLVLDAAPAAAVLLHHGAVPPAGSGGGAFASCLAAVGIPGRTLAAVGLTPRRAARCTCCPCHRRAHGMPRPDAHAAVASAAGIVGDWRQHSRQ